MKHEAFILVMLHNAECEMRGAVPAVRVDWEAWLKRKPTEAEAVGLSRTLAALEERGLLRRLPQRLVILTKAGCERAMVLKEAEELVECMPKAAADGGEKLAPMDASALDGSGLSALLADSPSIELPPAQTATRDDVEDFINAIDDESSPESNTSLCEYDEPEEVEPSEPEVRAAQIKAAVDDAPQSPPELTEADFGLPPAPLPPATVSPYERKPIRLSDLQRKKPERWTLLWSSNDP